MTFVTILVLVFRGSPYFCVRSQLPELQTGADHVIDDFLLLLDAGLEGCDTTFSACPKMNNLLDVGLPPLPHLRLGLQVLLDGFEDVLGLAGLPVLRPLRPHAADVATDPAPFACSFQTCTRQPDALTPCDERHVAVVGALLAAGGLLGLGDPLRNGAGRLAADIAPGAFELNGGVPVRVAKALVVFPADLLALAAHDSGQLVSAGLHHGQSKCLALAKPA